MQQEMTAGEIMDRFYINKQVERIREADTACKNVLTRDAAEGRRGPVNDVLFERHCTFNVGIAAGEALLNGTHLYVYDDEDVSILTETEMRERLNKAYLLAK